MSKPRRRKRRKKRSGYTPGGVSITDTSGPIKATGNIYFIQAPPPLSPDKIRQRFHQLKQRAANG